MPHLRKLCAKAANRDELRVTWLRLTAILGFAEDAWLRFELAFSQSKYDDQFVT